MNLLENLIDPNSQVQYLVAGLTLEIVLAAFLKMTIMILNFLNVAYQRVKLLMHMYYYL